jgi:hypothetical protein
MKSNIKISAQLLKMQRIAGLLTEGEYQEASYNEEYTGKFGGASSQDEQWYELANDRINQRLGRELTPEEYKQISNKEYSLDKAFMKKDSPEEAADEILFQHFGMDYE